MRVMERIAEFLGFLADRLVEVTRHQREARRENAEMAATLQAVLDKLTAQAAQIDELVASRDRQEQADLDKIMALIDGNGAKFTAALGPVVASSGVGVADGGSTAAPVVVDQTGGVTASVQDASGLVAQVQTSG